MLKKDGTTDIDAIYSTAGYIADITLLDTTIYTCFYMGNHSVKFTYLIHDFGYELFTIETGVDGQKEDAIEIIYER